MRRPIFTRVLGLILRGLGLIAVAAYVIAWPWVAARVPLFISVPVLAAFMVSEVIQWWRRRDSRSEFSATTRS